MNRIKSRGKNVHDRLSGQYLCSPSAKTKGNRKEELNVIASANYGAAEQPVKKEETVAAKPDVKEREKKVQNRKLFRTA